MQLENKWRIKEKACKNGMHLLEIYVQGQLVETIKSGSIKYLSSIANNRFAMAFNKICPDGWKIAENNSRS